jgi:2-polyprenyl-3-methyl-5-hydroxy-6-metoxy-1,4-benzoquinol methylase
MDLDVEQLMSRIKQSAARRKLEAPQSERRTRLPLQLLNSEFDLPEIRLSPEFKPRADKHYHVNDLLQFHDRDFVRHAYRAILCREPDEPGFNNHLEQLRGGRLNKIDILAILRFSAEGRKRNVTVDSLKFPALVRKLSRLPVIGYVFELVVGLLRLPISVYHNRQFQSHFIAQQQQVTDHVNRLTRTVRALEPFIAEVVSLREQIENNREHLRNLHQASEAHDRRMSEYDVAFGELSREDALRKAQLAGHETLFEQVQQSQMRHFETLEELRDVVKKQRLELSAQHARLTSALRGSDHAMISPAAGDSMPALERDASLDSLFVLLEERFRGERNEMKEKFKFYLPYLKRDGITENILDIGCGRGEWLELLKETGLDARGVDSNNLMVAECQAAGIDATHANVFDHFRQVPDHSLNAITAFHIIEHLEFPQLVDFVDQSIRALRPGGLLMLETPNPESVIVATRTFFLDPTHVKPLPAELIRFLLDARGLTNIEIVALHPLLEARVAGDTEVAARVNDLFYGPMDYGIIARRP